MMRNLNYTDFDIYKCVFELTAKSFLEVSSRQHGEFYHFHELIKDYLKNSNYKKKELFQAHWKSRLTCRITYDISFKVDNDDFVALTQIVHDNDFFSFEASIALMLYFPSGQQNLSSAARVLVSHCEVQGYNCSRFHDNVIVKGYTNLLKHVICQEEFPTEWNCMDVISLCLPIIDKLIDLSVHQYFVIDFSHMIMSKYLEMASPHSIWDSTWKHSLRVYAFKGVYKFTPFSLGLNFYLYSNYEKAIHSLHVALEDTSSPYDFMTYMILYDIHSRQDNLTGMEESFAGIHKLDFHFQC